MSKHTSGPWWFIKGWDERTYMVQTVENGSLIAAVPDVRLNAEANARLIAAAPELLESLKWAVKRIETSLDCGESFERAVAAIAKAEGRK